MVSAGTRVRLTLLLIAAVIGSAVPAEVRAGGAPAGPSSVNGRLIAFWRDGRSRELSVPGAAHTKDGLTGAWTLVVAKPGHAADVLSSLRSDPRIETIVPDAPVSI